MLKKSRIINIVFLSILVCTIVASAIYTGLGYNNMLFNKGTSAPANMVFFLYLMLWLPIWLGIGIIWTIVYFTVRKRESKRRPVDSLTERSGCASKDILISTVVFIALSVILLTFCIIQITYASNRISDTRDTMLFNITEYWIIETIIPYAVSIILLGAIWAVVHFKIRKSILKIPPEKSAETDALNDRSSTENQTQHIDVSSETAISAI